MTAMSVIPSLLKSPTVIAETLSGWLPLTPGNVQLWAIVPSRRIAAKDRVMYRIAVCGNGTVVVTELATIPSGVRVLCTVTVPPAEDATAEPTTGDPTTSPGEACTGDPGDPLKTGILYKEMMISGNPSPSMSASAITPSGFPFGENCESPGNTVPSGSRTCSAPLWWTSMISSVPSRLRSPTIM